MTTDAPPPPAAARATLRSRLLHAAKWTLLGYGGAQLIRLASNLVVTRLLAPEMMGLMALANVVMIGLAMMSDIGVAYAALRSPRGDDPRYLNAVWVVQIARGAVVTLLGLAAALALALGVAAPLVAAGSVFASPQLPPMLAVIAIGGLIQGFESTKVWWARRQLSMAKLTKLELLTQVATTLVMLGWAWWHPTVWALVGGYLFSALFKTALSHLWLPGPPNRFEWDGSVWRELFDFGKWTLLSSALTFALANGDRLILGSLVAASALGLYSIAFMLVNALQSAAVRVVGYAVLPALSEVVRERPAQLREAFYRVRRPLDMACVGSAGALVMLGPWIVRVLYDPRYEQAGWMLSILALTLLSTTLEVFDQCLVALGKPHRLAALNAARVVTLYALVPTGFALYGLQGAVGAIGLTVFVNAVLVLGLQTRYGLIDWRREAALPVFFGAGAALGWVVKAALDTITG